MHVTSIIWEKRTKEKKVRPYEKRNQSLYQIDFSQRCMQLHKKDLACLSSFYIKALNLKIDLCIVYYEMPYSSV